MSSSNTQEHMQILVQDIVDQSGAPAAASYQIRLL